MESLVQEVRLALRSLLRSRAFTIAAVLSLALGIGANTAIFSVVNGVLLRPAPVTDLDGLMLVWETDRSGNTIREPASIPDFVDFRARSAAFERFSAFAPAELNVNVGNAEPVRLAALSVTADYFGTTGLGPLLGRQFVAEEDRPGGPRAVMISEAFWASEFGRSPDVLGRTLRLNDVEMPIVGVMRDGADFGVLQVLGKAAYQRGFADRGGRPRVDLWTPLRANPEASRENHPIFVLGRLKPGVSSGAAHAEMERIMADLEREYPAANEARGAFVEPLGEVVFGDVRPVMIVLVAAVAMVLLVACSNVANLQLVRAAARAHEVTVRTALGASLGRIARQHLVEAALLALAGAVGGVLIAFGTVQVIVALAPATIPRAGEVQLDAAALGLTVGISVVIALVLGAIPTLHARRRDLQSAMRGSGSRGSSGGRGARALRSAFVVGELAMATTLMIGAGLLIKSLWTLQRVDPGFDTAGVLKAEFQLPPSRYPTDFSRFPDWPERQQFQAALAERLAAMPGVEAVALATANPLDAGFTSSIRVVGREAEASGWPEPSIRTVGANYFATLRVPQRAGRGFDATDHQAAPTVIIINESAAQRYFEGRDPLGSRINLWGSNRLVIGVVANERIAGLAAAAPPAVYMPLTQAPTPSAVLVRMRGDAAAAAPLVRQAVREVDPQLALYGIEPLDETLRGTMAERRFTVLVLAVFALAALTLAMIGVYGVLSYAVSQRTREIGIRVALGADLARVQRMVLGDGARLAGLGVLLGLGGAAALSGVMRSLLFGVGAFDPLTFGGVAFGLTAVALVACWIPARRAAQVDPIVALRAE